MVPQYWGALATQILAPTLLISAENDKLVSPENVRTLFAELKTPKKVFAELGCSSHFAPWETRHIALFHASAEWLLNGSVYGISDGTLRLGD
jgi:fermentation-respiration switch protein FrsA (DUF1100 family)